LGRVLYRFVLAMSAIRIFICWIYAHTESVAIAQLFHASSTGALVVFSPALVTPGQEAFWYFLYAAALWSVLGASAAILGLRFPAKAEMKLGSRPDR
jgi:hypothetical protein